MEGSAAAAGTAAASAAGQQGDGQESDGPEQAAVDYSSLLEQLSALTPALEENRQILQNWQEQQTPTHSFAPPDVVPPNGHGPEIGGDALGADLAQLGDLSAAVNDQVAAQVSPILEALHNQSYEQGMAELVREMPAIGESREAAGQVVGLAQQYAATHFPDAPPGLATSPMFLRLIALASTAVDGANEDAAREDVPTARLEGGGAAAAGGAGRVDLGDAIVQGAEAPGRRALPFP